MNPIELAYRRFSCERFPLPSEIQVRALEERVGVELPADYRKFILEFNGGYFNDPEITPVEDELTQEAISFMSGIGASHNEAQLGDPRKISLFDDNDPPKIMPIGATPFGGLIILDTAPGDGRGNIYLKKAFGDFYYLAEGIEGFFALLR
jgi:hypothetical protein